ncbi:oligosaccharide flippase family protein [Flexivirga sp.]|uniref:oligosaccharide flippase family protein n=1 Tax=Flexivirga sp. TaxID=1962927 RepID=UPI003F7ECE5F
MSLHGRSRRLTDSVEVQSRFAGFVPARFRAAAVNGFWAYMLQATNLLVALLLLPYLTRTLGRTGYGTFASALNYITYFSIVTAWGFDMWGAREAARKTPEELSDLFTRITWARTLLLGASVVALGGLAALSSQDARSALFAMMLALVGLTYNQTWLFLGTQRLRLAALATIFTKIPLLVAVFFVIRRPRDAVLYCVLYGASIVAGSVAQIFLARRDVGLRLVSIPFVAVRDAMRSAWPLFVANIMSTICNGVGITVLTVRANAGEVGDYAAVLRLATTALLLFAPLWTALYPQACRRYAISRVVGNHFVIRISTILLPVFGIISFAAILGRDLFARTVLGDAYADASTLLVPLMLWTFLGIVGNLIGTQCLVAAGHQKEYSRALVLSTMATVLLTVLLVPHGAVGVGWATALGQLASVIMMLVLAVSLNRRLAASSG